MSTPRIKIALACQGGGSQTAFTAGALKALLQAGVQDAFNIVTLTGTSGGAICAALAWYALRRGEPQPWARLDEFWQANTAQTLSRRRPGERAPVPPTQPQIVGEAINRGHRPSVPGRRPSGRPPFGAPARP